MSELIIKEERLEVPNLSKPRSGMVGWLAEHSGGMITEKTSVLIILATAILLIVFSVFYFFQSKPAIDTRKNYHSAEIE